MAGGWYGHHEAHRQAALKGWANRRRGGFSMTSEGVIMPRSTPAPARQPAPARARQPAQPPVKPPARAPRATRPTPARPEPLHPVGLDQYDPYARFDPYRLVRIYEPRQLHAVLALGTQRDLREAVRFVQARNPGTAPHNSNSKQSMIEYVMRHVAPGETRPPVRGQRGRRERK